MHRTTRITVALLFAAWAVDYIDRLVINLALPAIGDTFDLSHGERGLIISAFFLTYALFQVPGGLLADRFGGVRMACLALGLWSAFTGLTALSWSFAALLVVRLCFGAAQGLFPGAALNTLSARTVPAQRMTATGWVQSSNAIGGLMAALLASALLAIWNWRVMYVAVSVLGVFVLLAMVRWMPAPLPAEQSGQVARRARGATVAVLRSPAMWGFALLFFSYDVVIWGLNSWSASYLVEQRGLRIKYAGLLAIAPTLAAAAGAVIGGKLSDRLAGRPRRIIVPAMIVVALLLYLLPRTPSVATYVACGTLLSGAAGLCYLPSFSVPLRSLPPRLSGVASGMILLGGQISGIITPTVFGLVVDHHSYTAAFGVLLVGPLLAIVAVLCVPQTTGRFLSRFPDLGSDPKEDSDDQLARHRA